MKKMNGFMARQHRRCSHYHFAKIESKSAILILIWMALLNFENSFIMSDLPKTSISNYYFELTYGNVSYAMLLLLPLVGLMADMKLGRYRLIIACLNVCVIGLILAFIKVIIETVTTSTVGAFTWVIVGLYSLVFIAFRANVVPYYIELLIGASGEQLSSAIYWHFLSCVLPVLTVGTMHCFLLRYNLETVYTIINLLFIVFTVFVAIGGQYLFKRSLETSDVITNPIKVLVKVLNYARKNKQPTNRSALTFWLEDYPPRLDVGKEKYGGPFSEEEVEDVKTTLRMAPLLVCVSGYSFSCMEIYKDLYVKREETFCILGDHNIRYLVVIFLILLYQFLIHPCFHNYIPSMLKRIGLGLFLTLISNIFLMLIDVIGYHRYAIQTTSNVSFDNATSMGFVSLYWTIPSHGICGIAYVLVFITSLEFTVAQSPRQMRGLMVGLWYAAVGLGLLVSGNIHFLLEQNATSEVPPFGREFYYYLVRSVVVGVIFIVFLILARYYKLRRRGHDYNVYLTVDMVYDKYLSQKDLFYASPEYGSIN